MEDEVIDQQIRIKQEILKKEIIDNNYDQDKFFTFFVSKKENGDDLNNWTLLELNNVIFEFQTQEDFLKKKVEENQQKRNEEREQVEKMQLDIDQFSSLVQSPRNETYKNANILKIPCKMLIPSQLNDKKVAVQIKNPKPVERGFLKANYIVYEIYTEETQWSVLRRYSDFEWLRATLVKYYPRALVPPMPNKKIGSRRFEVDFVEKRMSFLQKFIDSLLERELFKASEALISFLSLSDRNQFDYKMKELTSYTPSILLSDIKTLTGTVKIAMDEENNEKYYTDIANYFRLQDMIYARLNFNMKAFYKLMVSACSSFEDIQKDFNILHVLNSKVQMKDDITKSYEELEIFCKNWRRMLFNQNEIIKTHLKDFFKYAKMEGVAYQELIKSRNEIRGKYHAEFTKLSAKKEKLWGLMDISKWEIIDDQKKIDQVMLFKDKAYACAKMCTRETQTVDNLRDLLGYANYSNTEELKKLIGKSSLNLLKSIKEFTKQLYPSLNNGLNIWTELETFLDLY